MFFPAYLWVETSSLFIYLSFGHIGSFAVSLSFICCNITHHFFYVNKKRYPPIVHACAYVRDSLFAFF